MTQGQSHQELIDLKLLLQKCFIAESKLACFLLDKASATDLPIDGTFKLKQLIDRVNALIRQLQASDDNSQDENPPTTSQNPRAHTLVVAPSQTQVFRHV